MPNTPAIRLLLERCYAWRWRGPAALALMILVILYAVVLYPAVSVRSGSATNRITDLQNAASAEAFIGALRRWSASNPQAVGILKRDNLIRLDSSFPVVYGFFLALGYAWASGQRPPTRATLVRFGAPLLAAAFDYGENALHLFLLRGVETLDDVNRAAGAGQFTTPVVAAAWTCAHAKDVLIVASAGSLILAIGARAWRQLRIAR